MQGRLSTTQLLQMQVATKYMILQWWQAKLAAKVLHDINHNLN